MGKQAVVEQLPGEEVWQSNPGTYKHASKQLSSSSQDISKHAISLQGWIPVAVDAEKIAVLNISMNKVINDKRNRYRIIERILL